MRKEPESGYLLCGEIGAQQVYERDDEAAATLVTASSVYTLEHRWFHTADGSDIYRFADLIKDYGTVVHLTVCPHLDHCCGPEAITP